HLLHTLCSYSYLSVHLSSLFLFFFFNVPAPTEIYTLSLHDALPICTRPIPSASARRSGRRCAARAPSAPAPTARARRSPRRASRSEEHTSELQSRFDLVCRLLLEKKKKKYKIIINNKHTN